MSDPLCPVDKTPLSRAGHTERCGVCNGAWIHEDALVAILEASTAAVVTLPWVDRDANAERPCAVCGNSMAPVALGSVALDRCAQHGVWFDADEFADLLSQSKKFREGPSEHHGVFERIAKMFGGD